MCSYEELTESNVLEWGCLQRRRVYYIWASMLVCTIYRLNGGRGGARFCIRTSGLGAPSLPGCGRP